MTFTDASNTGRANTQ